MPKKDDEEFDEHDRVKHPYLVTWHCRHNFHDMCSKTQFESITPVRCDCPCHLFAPETTDNKKGIF